jgi:hypothetical protein
MNRDGCAAESGFRPHHLVDGGGCRHVSAARFAIGFGVVPLTA